VLPQCPALAHLNLNYNGIGRAGAESLAGVLAQCTALAHLNIRGNHIGGVGREASSFVAWSSLWPCCCWHLALLALWHLFFI